MESLLKHKLNLIENNIEAIVIRTLPNSEVKKTMAYSNTNPPYLQKEAAQLLKDLGVKHLLIDLPSVDKEQDNGVLAAHHAFWDYPQNTRMDCSITELIYVYHQKSKTDVICSTLALPHFTMTLVLADLRFTPYYDRGIKKLLFRQKIR